MVSLLGVIKRSLWEIVVAAIILSGSAIATIAISPPSLIPTENLGSSLPQADLTTLLSIFTRNAAVALGLYSGLVTAGIGSIVFLILVGTMLGWSMELSVETLGIAETVSRSWAYTPLELTGFIASGAAGLRPAGEFIRRQLSPGNPGYHPLSDSLKLLGCAVFLLFAGALVETVAISLSF